MTATEPLIATELPLVGREVETALLQAVLERVRSGQGACLLLAGEAGVGKTRLCEELLESAPDLQVLRGWCLAETGQPLMAVREALRGADLEASFTATRQPELLTLLLMDESGILMTSARSKELPLDADLFTGMLRAVADFVSDSLGGLAGQEGALSTLGYQDHRIILETLGNHTLVAVISGIESEDLLAALRDLLESIQTRHRDALRDWGGEETRLAPVTALLGMLVASGRFRGQGPDPDDPRQAREQQFDNVLMGLQRLAADGPVVLYLDDLQWADLATLALLQYLARNTRGDRVLLLGTYRPEDILGGEGAPHPLADTLGRMESAGLAKMLEVERLDASAIASLTNGVLGEGTGPIADQLFAAGEGNPLYTRELLVLLLEEGNLQRSTAGWELGQEVLTTPHRVHDVIARRLARLKEADREVLEAAAVLGPEFRPADLACLLGKQDLSLLKSLARIERRHALIHSHAAGWAFDHSRIRELLYGALPADLRQAYHGEASRCLLEVEPDPVGAGLFATVRHLELAGDPRLGPLALKAAREAWGEFALPTARRNFALAVESLTETGLQGAALTGLGDVAELAGEYEEALGHFAAARELTDDGEGAADILRKSAAIRMNQGEAEAARDLLGEAINLAPVGSEAWARVRFVSGAEAMFRGAYEEAREHVQAALDHQGIPESARGLGIHILGTIELHAGDLDASEGLFLQAITTREAGGDRRGLAASWHNLGIVFHERGNLAAAQERYERSLQIESDIGNKAGLAASLTNVGILALDRGDLVRATESFTRAESLFQRIGDPQGEAVAIEHQGIIAYHHGNLEAARAILEASLTIRATIDDPAGTASVLFNRGIVAQEAGDRAAAKVDYAESMRIREDLGDLGAAAEVRQQLAILTWEAGDAATATKLNEGALVDAKENGLTDVEAHARILAGRMASDPGVVGEGMAMLIPGSVSAAEAAYYLAGLLAEDDPEAARAALGPARETYLRAGNDAWLARVDRILENLC